MEVYDNEKVKERYGILPKAAEMKGLMGINPIISLEYRE